ncbi:MAG TPA: hypothetical protein VHS58_02060 [Acetobacteraceae bacterium]|jgi:hypothetical protein|nr:hypothetical protein [Acetobacteraceae bacterium]
MGAVALFDRLRDLVVTVEGRGDDLKLRPASLVPADDPAGRRS